MKKCWGQVKCVAPTLRSLSSNLYQPFYLFSLLQSTFTSQMRAVSPPKLHFIEFLYIKCNNVFIYFSWNSPFCPFMLLNKTLVLLLSPVLWFNVNFMFSILFKLLFNFLSRFSSLTFVQLFPCSFFLLFLSFVSFTHLLVSLNFSSLSSFCLS